MKNKFRKTLLALIIFLMAALSGFADPPNPPDPGGVPTGGGGGVPVGAPIDQGTIMLIVLGTGYMVGKYIMNRKALNAEESSDEQLEKPES